MLSPRDPWANFVNELKPALAKTIERLRSSFWCLPTLMAAAAVAVALGMVALDEALTKELASWSGAYGGGAEGASAVL